MAFEIQEIVQTVKKNPVPWAIGLGVAVVGGYVAFKNSGGGYVTEAYPEQPLLPEDIAAGEAKPGGVTDVQLQELLAELERTRHEDLQQFAELERTRHENLQQQFAELERTRHEDLQQIAELNAQFMEGLARSLESYTSQQLQSYPQAPVQAPVQQVSPELLQKAEYIYSTPSIVFSQQGSKYTPAQVESMYGWAVEEQAAISRGAIGTSKNPTGPGAKDMTVTYYSSGHVEFTPKSSSSSSKSSSSSSKSSSSKPSGYTSSSLAEAARRESSGWTSQQVSKVTGKTGSVESQLSGMSQSEKISTLKKAGLI